MSAVAPSRSRQAIGIDGYPRGWVAAMVVADAGVDGDASDPSVVAEPQPISNTASAAAASDLTCRTLLGRSAQQGRKRPDRRRRETRDRWSGTLPTLD